MLFFYHSCYFSLFMLIFYDVEVKKSFDLSDTKIQNPSASKLAADFRPFDTNILKFCEYTFFSCGGMLEWILRAGAPGNGQRAGK